MTGAELRDRRRALGIRPGELAAEVGRTEQWLRGIEGGAARPLSPWAETQVVAAFRRIHARREAVLRQLAKNAS